MLIEINELNKTDFTQLSLLLSWRSNPLIFKNFLIQSSALEWNTHYQFIIDAADRIDYLVYFEKRPIGHLAISKLSMEYSEISIMIGETTLWGKGLSKQILERFIELLNERGFSKFSATILNENLSSIRLFKGIGFKFYSELPNNKKWSIYVIDSKKNEKGQKL